MVGTLQGTKVKGNPHVNFDEGRKEILQVQFDDNILMVTTFKELKCIYFLILDEPIDLTVWDELNIKV